MFILYNATKHSLNMPLNVACITSSCTASGNRMYFMSGVIALIPLTSGFGASQVSLSVNASSARKTRLLSPKSERCSSSMQY